MRPPAIVGPPAVAVGQAKARWAALHAQIINTSAWVATTGR